MADVMPENKNHDHILGLETDIQKSMKSGFPRLLFTKPTRTTLSRRHPGRPHESFFHHGSHLYLYLQSLPFHGQRNASRYLSDSLEDPVGHRHPCYGNMFIHNALTSIRPVY